MRRFVILLITVGMGLGGALSPAPAQEIRAAGGSFGRADSRQLWRGGTETSTREGVLLGAFVEVALPVSGLGILAEAYFVRRGSRIRLSLDDGGTAEELEARTDHLSFPVALVGRLFRDPVGAYAYAGPMVEYVMDVEAAPPVLEAYQEERQTLFSVMAGVGLELLLMERWSLRAEGRVVEGLTEIFDGPRGGIRHRSTELLVRVGFRPPGQGPPR